MIILKDLYFIENNIRILNCVAHGQKQQFDITQWRDATHYTQWGCTLRKGLTFIMKHETEHVGACSAEGSGDAQTGPPQDWPLSGHSVPQDDTALPETVLHFVLLYLTFPGISVNFLVLSLFLNSPVVLKGSKCNSSYLYPHWAKKKKSWGRCGVICGQGWATAPASLGFSSGSHRVATGPPFNTCYTAPAGHSFTSHLILSIK